MKKGKFKFQPGQMVKVTFKDKKVEAKVEEACVDESDVVSYWVRTRSGTRFNAEEKRLQDK